MNTGIRLTFDYVKNFFEKHGCVLLETEYKNARTKIKYKCSCGNISEIVFDSFRRGNRCRQCGQKRCADKQRYTQEEIAIIFEKKGCKLLGKYKSALKPVEYVCSCGKKSIILLNNFKLGNRCKTCGIAKRSGEHHYEWRKDRETKHRDDLFRQRCYKLVRMVLNVTGRVKNKHTAELLGYDYKQLQNHITKHPNYDSVKDSKWHIDHIFPIKAFVDHNITDLALINCLENLRPISQFENSSKNAKYCHLEFHKWLKIKGITYEQTNCRI
jgi:hypothetical protein